SGILKSAIYEGEMRDDTRAPAAGLPCETVEAPCRPEPQFSPPVRHKRSLKPRLLLSKKNERILDFGQNMAGVVRFQNRLKRGEKLRLRFFEVLQDGCFYRDNLRSARAEYVYVSDGREKAVEPFFTYYGFRYALVEGPETVDPEDFLGLALYSDLRETLSVETDNPKLNRLMRNALWGQRSNFLDLPVDCPQRDERLGWTGDAQAFFNTACYHMDCKDFYAKYLRDLRADQTRYYAGDIPMYSPSLKGRCGPGGAGWADAAVSIPWGLYQNYGDRALLERHYPMMRDYAETLIAADEAHGGGHIVRWGDGFGDWLALDGASPQSLKGATEDGYIRTLSYLGAMRLMALAAGTLGRRTEEARYLERAGAVLAAAAEEYLTPAGRLSEGTQTGYVLALHHGLWRDKARLVEGFRQRLKRDGCRIKTGFVGTPRLLPTLFDCGMAEEAFRILFNEGFPGWLYCVNLGATTIWERWNSLLPDGTISGTGMNSLNHYAYGSVCEAIYARIAGLQCVRPGWMSARIAPQVSWRMRRIDLRFDSPAGAYRAAWRLEPDGGLTVEAEVPAGAAAHIVLPDHPAGETHFVDGGSYRYSYRPKTDWLHPFSADTPACDLMGQAEAAAVMRERLPALYGMLLEPESEFAALSPLEISAKLPFIDAAAVREADARWRGIRL
ncbi:MAG: family 78 glycoside hydrolase catalytic domain, partial [Clostridia bacterium]|nr:family 78 glycoside hydrolase catalytic domain [Clostridia bacterium]